MGKVLAAGLAVTEEDLDAGIGVGIAFPQLVIDNNRRIGTFQGNRRCTPVYRVRLRNHVGVISQVQKFNIIQTVLIRK